MTDPTLRTEILAMAQGALTLDLAFVGITGGVLAALEAPHGTVALAQRTSTDLGYVRRWCEAAYAFELLDRQGDAWVLTDKGRAFLPDAPGTMMPVAIQAVLSAHMSDHAVTGLRTGDRPGEEVLGERENIGRWFGPMLEAAFGPMFDAHVLPAVSAFSVLDRPDARVADLACGNGWYLRRLAAHFDGVTGVGLDGYAPNITDAVARAEAEGVSDRLSFAVTDVLHHVASEPYHLVAMNRALHHVWAHKEAVFARIAEDLVPGGAAVIWEPRWPDDVEDLRRPPLRPLAFQNLAEHVQGNHFLRPEEVCDGLADAGLEPAVHLLMEGREMVITGTRAATAR
jgi:2-polyprenyl-3-methyl-5-hydroxy-6-metoxy-1,4-benzoquinol methylase